MDFQVIGSSLTNPTLLFFVLGIVAVLLKSDLEIPASSSKFLSLYLLFSIGFNGGQELEHSGFSREVLYALAAGMALAVLVPCYSFFLLKRRMRVSDAGAVAASYGSVSAVTFVAAASFLEIQSIPFSGHMVAVMASMEFPAIMAAFVLMKSYDREEVGRQMGFRSLLYHSLSNGSVLILIGSLLIGLLTDARQAAGIRPFTSDIFKGFLALFLLEMGMLTARRFAAFRAYGRFAFLFAILIPAFNGSLVAWASQWLTSHTGDRFMFSILAASASYIAVPSAMRLAAPRADPGLYIPMALGVTFPFNISVGIPLYFCIITGSGQPV